MRKVQLGITADDEAKLLNDIKALNLTRYVSELVDAVSETRKTKDRDCSALARVCGALHSRLRLLWRGAGLIVVEERSDDADDKRQRAA